MKLRTLILTILILASTLVAEAGGKGVRNFRLTQETTPVLVLSNPATIGFWNGRIATVEVGSTKGNGGLISLDQSPDDFTVGALTESYFRVSEHLVFHGKISWSHFYGKDMGGQVMMHPEFHPVCFFESDETTIGVKKRELYDLTGGLALNLGSSWSLGFRINYGAGDQTKIKDPRFSNIRMDLDLNAGIAFRPSRNLVLGLAFQYENKQEQVRGGIYGATDKQYFIQNDRGNYMGTVEELNGDYNIISTTGSRPMDNRFLGASLQVILFDAFSSDFSYRKRSGYYGKKSTTSPVYYEFEGYEAGYKGSLTLPSGNNIHHTALEFNYSKLGNNENRFKYITPTGGNTTVEYTAKNHIMDRSDMAASVLYRWIMGADKPWANFIVGAKGSYFSRNQKTTIYPFYRTQKYSRARAEIFAEKSFCIGKMSYIPAISGMFQTGWGVAKKDGSYVDTGATKLKSFDNYLNRQYEFETATRAGGTLSFTLSRNFSDKAEGYIKIYDSMVSLIYLPTYLSGRIRNIAGISVGCNF